MKISIALASYNGEKYILDQLKSFANQSKIPDEVIISDDCSTDNTIKLIKQFSIKAPFRIEIHQNKSNLGYAQNFNNALLKTSGDLIFLSDQDDVWFDNKLEDIYKIAASSKSLLIMNNAEITDAEMTPTGINKLDQIRLINGNDSKFVMGCCAAIKRELLDLVLPIDINFPAHDTWISWLGQFMNLKEVTPEVMQYYRRHGKNQSNYIGNSIYKFSKINSFFLRVKHLIFNKKNDLLAAELSFKIFTSNLKILVAETGDHRLHKEINLAYQLSCDELKSIQCRLRIRKSFFIFRFYKAAKFYFQGGYKSFSGLKSLFRDIIFH